MLFWFKAPVDVEPEVGSLPLQAPDAEQEVALVEVQVMVLLCPDETAVGEALKATVGAGVIVVGPKKLVTSTSKARVQEPLPFLPWPA